MALYMKSYRAMKKAESMPKVTVSALPDDPVKLVAILSEWAEAYLIIPAGHPLAGEAMTIPDFGQDFLVDALSHRESLLCMARKNAKSAICAILALGYLVGPLRQKGWRGAVASLSKDKANELRLQIEQIAIASGLTGLDFRRSPQPGYILSPTGQFDVLSADKGAGHASGYDVVLVDELGLFPENARALMAGLRSSISARNGRIISISVRGDSVLLQEVLDRADLPSVAVHLYGSPDDCDLDDVEAWQAANPGLGTIKSLEYMQDEAARVRVTPADQSSFRAYDLNQALDPARTMIVTPSDWQGIVTDTPADKAGPVVVGVDLGGTASMTALVAIWVKTGRMEAWGAFGNNPSLEDRGVGDGVGSRYRDMFDRGELSVYPGRNTPVESFLKDCFEKLKGYRILALGCDRYRQGELLDAVDKSGFKVGEIELRGQGASTTADGSADIRSFQRLVYGKKLSTSESLLLASAIKESTLRYDGAGNPALDKGRSKGRIDPLSAGVIAAGLAEKYLNVKQAKRPRLHIVTAT